MGSDNKIKIGISLSRASLEWIDGEVERVGLDRTNRSAQIETCIVHRRLSMMPKAEREKIAKAIETAS